MLLYYVFFFLQNKFFFYRISFFLQNKSSKKHDETDEASTHLANTTFEVSVPKIIHNESVSSSNDNDFSEKLESLSEQSPKVPINVTITDKKCKDLPTDADVSDTSNCDKRQSSLREDTTDIDNGIDGIEGNRNNNVNFDRSTTSLHDACMTMNDVAQETDITSNRINPFNKSESLIKFDDSIVIDTQANQKDITKQNSINSLELSIENNVQSKRPINAGNNLSKTIYFDEIIVGGERKIVSTMNETKPFLESLPTINQKTNSIFGDLPPLNGKKANINDLKELMDISLGKLI